jgi:8-oxo-dGTP pyrophosphatase MutT (NUDIX family)
MRAEMILTHAGAVAFRKNKGRIEYLVISSSNGEHWVLPKGHIEAGESPEGAALRELREEAGQEGEIVKAVSEARYTKAKGERVAVRYFLVRASGSAPAREGRVLRWEEDAAALGLLSFDDARAALQQAAASVHRLEA